MAYGKIKTDGKGRWCRRLEAKTASKKVRRERDKKTIKQSLKESLEKE